MQSFHFETGSSSLKRPSSQSIIAATDEKNPLSPIGECRWGGAASTHFWFSRKDDLAVIVMQQHMPFIRILEDEIKPIVYTAIEK